MSRAAFVTVSDRSCFPGTLAAVNSVLEFHPDADIHVVAHRTLPLAPAQAHCLQTHERVQIHDAHEIDPEGRCAAGRELLSLACRELGTGYEVIAGIDPDCVLCSKVSDLIETCQERDGFLGGNGLFLCAVTAGNRDALARSAHLCGTAPPHAFVSPRREDRQDGMTVAPAVLERASHANQLDDRSSSLKRSYWNSIIDFRDGNFVDMSASGARQRWFHGAETERFWLREHRDRLIDGHPLQTYPYVWFLTMMWFGGCGDWTLDPCDYLPSASHHLAGDLIQFLPQILQVYPRARYRWNSLSDAMLDRLIDGVPRRMDLRGGGMSDVIALVALHPGIRRYVEVGSYEGGSILTLGLRFLNRDIDFYAVESFMGNLNGMTDGAPLPSRRKFLDNTGRYPGLRVTLVPGDSGHAAALFDDGSLDCVFIDACHDTWAVLRDIDVWLPKLRPGAIIAGDDYGFDSVYDAVQARFSEVNITPSGFVWWVMV
jgi:hypothetical protein